MRATGPRNGKWKRGTCLNEKGYVKITTSKHRNKYEHRLVIETLLESPLCSGYVFPAKGKIPPGMTVDHIDHSRKHNCISNLMLLDKPIHDYISRKHLEFLRAYDNKVPF